MEKELKDHVGTICEAIGKIFADAFVKVCEDLANDIKNRKNIIGDVAKEQLTDRISKAVDLILPKKETGNGQE